MALRSWSYDSKPMLDALDIRPGEGMIVKRLPCVDCNERLPRYISRRLCSRCYIRRGKRAGLGRLSMAEQYDVWTVPYDGHTLWIGGIKDTGYASARGVYIHRWAYEHFVAPIPDGLVIDHLCALRWCVNPDHLEPVPQAENIRRGRLGDVQRARHAARTHCKWGHEYTPENVRYSKTGVRSCRVCPRERAAGTHLSQVAS